MDDRASLRAAKARLVAAMDQGVPWEDAATTAGLLISRATAYRLWLRACCEGNSAFEDRRHGQSAKVCGPIPAWIIAQCQAHPHTPSHALQIAIQERLGIIVHAATESNDWLARGVSGLMAEQYSRMLSSRMKDVRRWEASQGRHIIDSLIVLMDDAELMQTVADELGELIDSDAPPHPSFGVLTPEKKKPLAGASGGPEDVVIE